MVIKDQIFVDFVGFLSMIIYVVSLYTQWLRYICSAWFLDITVSTLFCLSLYPCTINNDYMWYYIFSVWFLDIGISTCSKYNLQNSMIHKSPKSKSIGWCKSSDKSLQIFNKHIAKQGKLQCECWKHLWNFIGQNMKLSSEGLTTSYLATYVHVYFALMWNFGISYW